MKKLFSIFIVALSIFIATAALSGVTKLRWTYNYADNTYDSFKLYVETVGPDTVQTFDIPKVERTYLLSDLGLLPQTNYVMWLTAVNINGESDPSAPVVYYSSVPGAPVLEIIYEE